MDNIDLFAMRERFNSQQIMLCFNGPISRSLIDEIGNALRNYLAADHAHPSAAMDVFAVYDPCICGRRVYLKNLLSVKQFTPSLCSSQKRIFADVLTSRCVRQTRSYVVRRLTNSNIIMSPLTQVRAPPGSCPSALD